MLEGNINVKLWLVFKWINCVKIRENFLFFRDVGLI